jgi:AraC family transcriptional activator of tynA and feaB
LKGLKLGCLPWVALTGNANLGHGGLTTERTEADIRAAPDPWEDATVRIETFSTDGVPPQARPRVWRQAMGRLAGVDFGFEPIGAKPFRAKVTAYLGRRLKFSAYDFSPHVTTCSPQAGAKGHFILAYLKEGSAVFAQDGREASVEAGGIVLFDPRRPLCIQATMRVHSLDVSSEQMKAVLPQVDGLTSIALKNEPGSGSLLRSMLDELFQSGANLNDAVSDRVADAIPHIIAAALESLPETAQAIPTRLEAYHRERIREFVRRNLRNPDLNPEMVARAVGLSLRHVHELAGKGPTTLMRWIWSERLLRCRDELALPSLRHRSIGEIAYSWGFCSQAHFSRVFRACLGQSPRSFRDSVLKSERLELA